MFSSKMLINYTTLFTPYDLKKMIVWFWSILKMNESNSIKAINRTNLTNQTKFRLNEISNTENYFKPEIKERKLNSKKISKYVAAFEYINKIVIILSVTSGGVSIISFATVIRLPVGIASASFT